ncbi:MAG: hypothetical protein KF701_05025 [Anaerolineales bacterium]|nr:MAG: hypothetical protein KF701_05025 [Anaerolineales bacterium]
MVIKAKGSHIHWNYFLALESDLETISRYIEFSPENYKTYSIELAHLFLASSSEVDVVAKLLCEFIAPGKKAKDINDYRSHITKSIPEFADEEIFIPRFGLDSKPWSNFKKGKSPVWWADHNKVKHGRHEHFSDANLKNVVNSVGALLVLNFYYHKYKLQLKSLEDVGHTLVPQSKLLELNPSYYPVHLLIN